MLIAGLAASAAIDLVSQLLPEKASAKSGTGIAARPSFNIADLGAAAPQSVSQSAAGPGDGLSRDALDTLLSAQGQGTDAKKRSMSVLLELLQSSQNGSVNKADFEAAAGESQGEASALFDRIDQNHDTAINRTELTAFLDSYRKAAETGTQGWPRALAVVV